MTVDQDTVHELAKVAGIDIPDACLPGVADTLRLLMEHSARLDEAEVAP